MEPSVGFNGVIGRTFRHLWSRRGPSLRGLQRALPTFSSSFLTTSASGQLGCFDFTGTVRHVTVDVKWRCDQGRWGRVQDAIWPVN